MASIAWTESLTWDIATTLSPRFLTWVAVTPWHRCKTFFSSPDQMAPHLFGNPITAKNFSDENFLSFKNFLKAVST